MPFEKFIQQLIDEEIIPGITILVGQGGRTLFSRQYGCKSLLPDKEPLDENTLYDTASLTKPLITALAVQYLSERGEFSLDTAVKKFFPHLPFDITIHHLLTHTGGLPAWFPFYLYGPDYLATYSYLDLQSRPGRKVIYSCPGYILLYHIIQAVAGRPFHDFIQDLVFRPLGLTHSFLRVPQALKNTAAPTELGNTYEKKMAETALPGPAQKFDWREHLIQGDTHDVNSHFLGGTAGNAGLFSTAADLFKLAGEFYPDQARLLKPETIRLCWKNLTPFKRSHRTIGFKLNSSWITAGGPAISRSAIGHSGFTGVSLWLEPGAGYRYILLTNRIHPQVKPVDFDRVRRKLHRLLKRGLGLV